MSVDGSTNAFWFAQVRSAAGSSIAAHNGPTICGLSTTKMFQADAGMSFSGLDDSGKNGIARPSVTALGITFERLSRSRMRSSISSRGPRCAHETGPSSCSACTSREQTRWTVVTRSSSGLRISGDSVAMSSSNL